MTYNQYWPSLTIAHFSYKDRPNLETYHKGFIGKKKQQPINTRQMDQWVISHKIYRYIFYFLFDWLPTIKAMQRVNVIYIPWWHFILNCCWKKCQFNTNIACVVASLSSSLFNFLGFHKELKIKFISYAVFAFNGVGTLELKERKCKLRSLIIFNHEGKNLAAIPTCSSLYELIVGYRLIVSEVSLVT